MTVKEQMNATKAMMTSLTFMIDDIEDEIKNIEEVDPTKRTDAQKAVLKFAKHLKMYYEL